MEWSAPTRWRRTAGLVFLLLALLLPGARVCAGLLAGNVWPNPTLETDGNSDGLPDSWHRGGTAPGIAAWSTESAISPTHAFKLSDASATTWGEWYSDLISITGGAQYQLRYNLRYVTTNNGAMRVSVNFYDAGNSLLSGTSFVFSGSHDFWEEITQTLAAPAMAARLGLTFTSGGGVDVTGFALLDDISLALGSSSSLIPYVEAFPALPDPLVIRDWSQAARSYHQLAFNPAASGPQLPLLYEYTLNSSAGYSGPAFGLPSYVGNPPGGGEALTALGAVLGATLAGLDMSSLNGVDRVRQCEAFYCVVNGHGLVLNNINSSGSGSAWYDIFPSTQFYQIGARYPGRASFQNKMKAIADSWLAAAPILSNNWEHTGFSFQTLRPVDQAWDEPDMAIGIAWLEYIAWLQFQNSNYLAAADLCMTQVNHRSLNPFYETLGFYGPVLAARMNAELGRSYSVAKHLNWIFAPTSDARPGWGCESGRWGAYGAYGLMGSTTDSSGYAFSMNSYVAPGLIAPVARYQPQYARLIGRWLLQVAANANLFYPDTLPANMQSSADWVRQTGIQSISYEGVRRLSVTTPYATGDAAAPIQDLNPYGAWASGYLAALFRTSNVPAILQVNCLATDTLPPPAYPSLLFYNPYGVDKQVTIDVGPGVRHLYDSVTGSFLATNVTGEALFSVRPDAAVLLVLCPATGAVSQSSEKLLVSGVVVDYWNATRDADRDGLPDWWESRYFGNATNAAPDARAANGYSNRECYQLGLDPTKPGSTFKARAAREVVTDYPLVTWDAVGGRTYAVEYADRPAGAGNAFAEALVTTETNVAAGVETIAAFLDDYTLTGGPPGGSGRYYRIRLVAP